MAIQRANYKNRGPTYTDLGIAIRCARHNGDQSSITNTVHYLSTGGATIKFVARKQEFLIPVILIVRALSGPQSTSSPDAGAGSGIGITDEEMYRRIVQGDDMNTFLRARAELLLQDARARFPNLNTPDECLGYIGSRFRRLSQKAESTKDVEIGHYMIRRYILIHLPGYKDKLECLLLLLRKMYSFAAGDCGVDNADSLQNQELLMPGHLISTMLKEKFEEMLQVVRLGMTTEMRRDYSKFARKIHDATFWGKLVDRYSGNSSGGIGKKIGSFLSTGNIVSTSGLDLMQVSGYTIVAERLNFLRFCAHFRSVHRGSFFMEMKTTAVRKLLPDQWGFLCPVHTPDGGPCGLLSHLSLECIPLTHPEVKHGKGKVDLDDLLISLGAIPTGAGGKDGEGRASSKHTHFPVCLDGRVVGSADPNTCRAIAAHLRFLKVEDPPTIPETLEVAMIPQGDAGSPYPGLYLFTEAARMVRPVLQRATGKTEKIGPMEQAFMDIACLDEDVREGITTHQELDPTNMLSLIANMTPFSDQNQSPRNMYQCQMGKQTMGTPAHSLPYRVDNKLYRLQNPQAPVVQTGTHGRFRMDEYPNGTNAVVAVLSYTGFDMEDAMILSKCAYERGFGHASVYKTIEVDLQNEAKMAAKTQTRPQVRFANKLRRDGQLLHTKLELDGLPQVGGVVEKGDPLYCVVNDVDNRDNVGKHKESETAYVQSVRMVGSDNGDSQENKVKVTLRFNRNPVIGDKFSSRHGQKGVLSILWPQEDMPFSESGISPDVIINPHAFPSRMTIGMLVESMAGKAGALHGMFQDATPFSFHESGEQISVDYFGEQLRAAGYNYYGSEPLYSGVSGCLMQADLYIGVVYYQRLRHMVSDKYQVRATGPVNPLTRQPIKGRKKGGGIRLGEMERDSLLSHGTAFLLQDRLLNCSDKHIAHACSRCGDMLMPTTERSVILSAGQSKEEAINKAKLRLICRNPTCLEKVSAEGNDDAVEPIILPYVYRYLVNELAAMNVKLKLEIK
jgi:DNA-directed RNA polymerase I subunit RPA2